MTHAIPFSQAGYRELLSRLGALGYTGVDYEDVDPAARHVILRHDIDFSLEAAVPVAEIEHELGWRAHYFFLVRGEFYNCLGATGAATISTLSALGHRIGLHLDCSLYGDTLEAIEAGARREIEALEGVADKGIDIISFHRPADALIGLEQRLAGRLHAYMPRFFSDIGYCSDSQGSWRFQAPLEHDAVNGGTALQLLTHPIWWPARAMTDPTARLETFVAERGDRLRDELTRNCRSYHRDQNG